MFRIFIKNPATEKAFYLGLFIGLTMLFSITIFGNVLQIKEPGLSVYTTEYTLMAIIGGILSLYRFIKTRPKDGNEFNPELISIGLLVWSSGQILWMIGMNIKGNDLPYPWYSDVPYVASLIIWLIVLLKLYRPLKLKFISASKILSGVYKALLAGVVALIGFLDRDKIVNVSEGMNLIRVITDFLYLFLPLSSAFIAGILYLTPIPNISLKAQKCIAFLFYATLLNFLANSAFVVTFRFIELQPSSPLVYTDGGWIDYLYLSSMTCWCIATTIYPTSLSDLTYSFGNYMSININATDVFKAANIAEEIFHTNTNTGYMQINSDTTLWIMENLPHAWKIIKSGDDVIGSAIVLPVSDKDIEDFRSKNISEAELFRRVKTYNAPIYENLYLAGATILAEHRFRGLAFQCFVMLIETDNLVVDKKPNLICWPISNPGLKLSIKLKTYFTEKGYKFEVIDHQR